MSFFRKLFGSKDAAAPAAAASVTAEIEYKGYVIKAAPRLDKGQFLVAGSVERTIDGTLRTHTFVRADRSPDRDEISEMALAKGRLMIDQQGDGLFG